MKDIVIIGSGGFAKEVAFLIKEINLKRKTWNILGYIDNNLGEIKGTYKVFQNDDWLKKRTEDIHVVFGIGSPSIIKNIYNSLKDNKHINFPNLIHPNVIGDWERINLGEGNIICASNTFTTDIIIGNCNIFNLDCTLGHDSNIGNFNVINPSANISGGVTIHNNTLIGTGAIILQNLSIVSSSIVGGGAVLTKNIVEAGVYVGNPAKILKKKND